MLETVQFKTYTKQIIILPVVSYDCDNWPLIRMEEHRLRVLENKVMRRICVTKRVKITGRRKLHKEKTALPMVLLLLHVYLKEMGLGSTG
jgi:hypothetical protein